MKVIAEVGSNWYNLDQVLFSIRSAKAYGADAVKFQLFDEKSLYGVGTKSELTPSNGIEYNFELPVEWLKQMKEEADHYGIELMCSAFSPELADKINPYVSTHKIASSEMNHVRLLEKINSFKKPVLLSCAAVVEHEIWESLKRLPDCDVTLMYCIGAYPAKHTLLSNIGLLRDTFKKKVGFSDHSLEVFMNPIGAQLAGAEVIEKHVNFYDFESPDSEHSLSGVELKLMCQAIKGDVRPHLGPTPEENDMVSRHRRRLIATKDIKVGEMLKEGENFGIYRSLKDESKALSPWLIDKVNGKRVVSDIKAGDGIGPKDI